MFLLVPAHPGCPGQNPKSRKTVVVVVVVVIGRFERIVIVLVCVTARYLLCPLSSICNVACMLN